MESAITVSVRVSSRESGVWKYVILFGATLMLLTGMYAIYQFADVRNECTESTPSTAPSKDSSSSTTNIWIPIF